MSRKQVKLSDVRDVQQFINEFWMGLGDTDKYKVHNSLLEYTKNDSANPSMWLLKYIRNPDNFYFTCKWIFNIELLPFQLLILKELWNRPFPMLLASRGSGKSFMLGLYVIMRLLLTPKCKVVVTGAGLRQSRLIYDYSEMIWRNAPVLRSIVGNLKGQGPAREIDRFTFNIGNCRASFLPIGNGEKIRGERSGYTITDEFNSVDCEIYENVIAPFGAVTLSPIENVKKHAQEEAMKALGILLHNEKLYTRQKNQQVLSGTPGYHFQHFYRYYMKQKAIIESGGNVRKLTEILGAPPDDDFDWRDYSIMQLPYDLIPPGFMETTQIARSRATVDTGRFNMEYLATFIKDSNGFFRRSLIEGCVVSPNNIITLPSCGQVMFSASLIGSRDRKYIISIDPASESDNFSITILEQHSDHARIVYCWTTNRQKFKSKLKNGTNPMKRDFYGYCVRKIRDLMRLFNIEHIGLDTQGGGIAIEEGLASPLYIEDGEVPIYPIIDPDKPLPTDGLAGLHILHRINFADAKWTSEANHGMRKDFEDKMLLFPYYDQVSIALASEEDMMLDKDEDTLEDCVLEIEELKDELTTIVMSQTAMNNRERWDTPETKEPGTNKKGRLRKDRYSSLLIGNMIARSQRLQLPDISYDIVGRVASDPCGSKTKSNKMYGGDARWAEVTEDCFVAISNRGRV